MSSIEELRETRINKIKLLEEAGMNPYTATSQKDFDITNAISDFESLSEKDPIHLVGRILALRDTGGLIFVNFNDGTATFQALLKKEDSENFELFQKAMDIGDFVEFTGKLFITKRGEKTIEVKSWRILTKSIRPLPEKWHGLKDEDERFRKRYLDIISNEESREIIIKRAKFWASIRNFLTQKGFMEVDTPVIENTTGGAEARPFKTHYNAYDIEAYLRISPELWLKKLMVAGFPKIFEIGRNFRNEGADAEHLQDYMMMEFYFAYADYNDGMKMVEEMYKTIAQETFGTLQFKIRGFNVDFGGKWEKYDYVEIIQEKTGINILKADIKEIEKKLQELDVEYDRKGFNLNRGIDTLWKFCRKQIGGPGFLINVPVFMEPLAKRSEKDKNIVERFQVILAGSEMGKGFSELNDPIDQLGRFNDQAKLREGGDEEAQMTDNDFVEALEYGMPPTCGFGLSERLFSFMLDKSAREGQIFPFMRPKS